MAGSSLTTYGKDQHLAVYRGTTLVPPTNWYAAIFTADPTPAGTLTSEVSTVSTGYARKVIPANFANWDAIVGAANNGRMTSNTLQQIFGIPLLSWGTPAYLGLMDAPTGGNMWHRFELIGAAATQVGVQVYLDPGDLDIIFDEA
jgi:hypothetical protein